MVEGEAASQQASDEGDRSSFEWSAGAVQSFSVAALASTLAYLLAFLYEAGFASTFNLPLQFISPTLTSVLIFLGAVIFLGFVFVGWPIQNFPMLFFAARRNPNYVLPRLFWLGAVTLILSFAVRPWILWFVDLIIMRALALRSKHKDLSGDPKSWHLYPLLIEMKIGRAGLASVIACFFALSLPFYMGAVEARSTWSVWRTDTVERNVVIRIYGDTVISMPEARHGRNYDEQPAANWHSVGSVVVKPVLKVFRLGEKDTPALIYGGAAEVLVDWPTARRSGAWWMSVLQFFSYRF